MPREPPRRGPHAPDAVKFLHTLKQRAKCYGCDPTAYEDVDPTKWMPHWTQRISTAIATGDPCGRHTLLPRAPLKGEAARLLDAAAFSGNESTILLVTER